MGGKVTKRIINKASLELYLPRLKCYDNMLNINITYAIMKIFKINNKINWNGSTIWGFDGKLKLKQQNRSRSYYLNP